MNLTESLPLPDNIQQLATPALLLEQGKLKDNIQRLKSIAKQHNVALRTHMKTSKSADIATLLMDDNHPGIAVSTLREAEYFAAAGCRDILYAVSIEPRKFAQLKPFYQHNIALQVILDDIDIAKKLAVWAEQEECQVHVWIEIDTDGHRAGIKPDHNNLVPLAQVLASANSLQFCGVMTHGGDAYNCRGWSAIQQHAAKERDGCVYAAERIRQAGIAVNGVSIGSTPTVLAADHFDGVTEIRPGVYVFFDLFQHGLQVCELSDIAISVATTVIAHQRQTGRIFLDAGGLALSKDHSTASQPNDYHYGLVCDAQGQPLRVKDTSNDGIENSVLVNTVFQEHGVIHVSDPQLFAQLPIGTLLRILPNHACMTAAAYNHYHVIERSEIIALWQRCNGWMNNGERSG